VTSLSQRRPTGALIAAQLLVAGCLWVAASVPGRAAAAEEATPSTAIATSGCGSLIERLRSITSNGQSAIAAHGVLTGRSKTIDLTRYVEMRLTQVQTLRGKKLPDTLSGWLESSPEPASSAADAPGLWGQTGGLVSIVTPHRIARTPVGPVLSIAPLIKGDVILNAAGCWADPSLKSSVFHGSLREVPGSNAYSLAERAGGFRAYSLSRFSRLLR
jgi:hypothetical protein